MQSRPNKVLILGCGIIGQIKARLWLSLGADVYLHDTTPSQVDKLLKVDKQLKRFNQQKMSDLTVDISTPSDQHAASLLWTFSNIKNPRTVLIEKPICTNASDKVDINRLLDKHKNIPVYVNESYFLSSALDWLLHQLHVKEENITSIEINLSKNRLADTRAGRFFDQELESYGIEIPHAIAVLQRLGIDIDELKVCINTIYRNEKNFINQGVHLTLSDKCERSIKIDSFLGDFMIHDGKKVQNFIARWLIVKTNKQNKYHISFDPAPNGQRFKSSITINNNERLVLSDDHLRRHLEQIQSGELSSAVKQYLSPTNSMVIYDFLEKLHNSKSEDYIPDTVVQYNEVGERAGVL